MAAPAFETTWPLTLTRPAMMSARARSRDAASPRSTSATSRRVFRLATRLTPARDNPVGDRREPACQACARQGVPRARHAFGCDHPGAVETEEGRVGGFRGGRVLAGCLSQ